jgi:hypothetical protein
MLTRSPADADRKRELRRERKQRYCHRQAGGFVCLRVEVNEHDLAAALQHSGRLTPDQALHRSELETAVAQIVADFIARWGMRPL